MNNFPESRLHVPARILAGLAAALLAISMLSACSSVYYTTMEKLGKQKRDLLRDNVEELREDQMEAKEEFKDALTRLQELTAFHGGDLQEIYEKLKDDYEDCEERADAIRSRIDKIDTIANDLFAEWADEIDTMHNASFKRKSREKLAITKRRYRQFHRAMKKSEQRLEPVLTALHDHVLFLKHNLNAQAVAGLKSEVGSVAADVRNLIRDMQASIAEADAFIRHLPSE